MNRIRARETSLITRYVQAPTSALRVLSSFATRKVAQLAPAGSRPSELEIAGGDALYDGVPLFPGEAESGGVRILGISDEKVICHLRHFDTGGTSTAAALAPVQ